MGLVYWSWIGKLRRLSQTSNLMPSQAISPCLDRFRVLYFHGGEWGKKENFKYLLNLNLNWSCWSSPIIQENSMLNNLLYGKTLINTGSRYPKTSTIRKHFLKLAYLTLKKKSERKKKTAAKTMNLTRKKIHQKTATCVCSTEFKKCILTMAKSYVFHWAVHRSRVDRKIRMDILLRYR